VRMGLFQACHAINDYVAAQKYLQTIIKRQPDHAEAWYGLAVLALEQGVLDEARALVQRALLANPYHVDAWVVWADLRNFEAEDEETALMQHIYEQSPAGSDARMKMAFTLARFRHDLADYDEAFRLMKEANAIRHANTTYDARLAIDALNAVAAMQPLPRSVERSGGENQPVCLFVIGMPRSGSTLVEQILAAHPQVEALGENGHLGTAIKAVVGDKKTLAWLNSLPDDVCIKIGQAYLQCLQEAVGTSGFYCDKTLTHIGLVDLIQRALPSAKIIHVRRHPLDTCLSIFRNNLQGADFGYGSDLDAMADYYAAYLRLMAHWREQLPSEQFYELDYETLVADQRNQTAALLTACGLTWDDACLDFRNAIHAVQTASAAQVRKPLTSASVGLWRHYEKQLAPLHGLKPESKTASAR